MSEVEAVAAFNGALAKAQAEMRGVEKSSRNDHHRYKYASSEDVIANARHALAAHGLSVFAVNYRVERAEGVAQRDNREGAYVYGTLVTTYRVAHAGGYAIECKSDTPIIPGKGRPPDKAVATAKTYDLGYFLRALLLIERVEEGADPDSRNDSDFRGRQERRERPRETRPPAREPTQKESAALEELGHIYEEIVELSNAVMAARAWRSQLPDLRKITAQQAGACLSKARTLKKKISLGRQIYDVAEHRVPEFVERESIETLENILADVTSQARVLDEARKRPQEGAPT